VKIIVPCCGSSTRYPNQPPKWMLPAPDGQPMLTLAVSGFDLDLDQVVVVILREHDEAYGARQGINDAFGREVEIVVLDEPTSSQAETVASAIRALDLDEPFLVKDSDNCFTLDDLEQDDCYVSVDSLNNHDLINPRNKSYVQVDHNGLITNIREKEVISDLFSVGGYFFNDASNFLDVFDRLAASDSSWNRELYISDIVGSMVLDGTPVLARRVEQYQDWGTVHEWRRTLLASRTIFVALDGFVLERGSEHFSPRFAEVAPNKQAVDELRRLRDRGHSVILLSIRPKSLEGLTRSQLERAGLGDLEVVYDCHSTAWRLVGSPHSLLPFNTVEALEVEPDDPNLAEKLLE
jgi:dTDP-glucose pyrophosphorylase